MDRVKAAEMMLPELMQSVSASQVNDVDSQFAIKAISDDSRKVSNGTLFCAYKGDEHDGSDYIEAALMAGACAILMQQCALERINIETLSVPVYVLDDVQQSLGNIAACFYRHPAKKLRMHAVTGTNGKTTVAYLLAQSLTKLGATCAYIGTIGNGLINQLSESTMTTSGAIELQKTLAQLVDLGASDVALEVSSHALAQRRVAGSLFASVTFTNLSQDHLDYHGSLAAYGQAKKKLFTCYASDYAVINVDDEFAKQHLLDNNAQHTLTYGQSKQAQLQLVRHKFKDSQSELMVRWNGADAVIQSPLVGCFNALNVMATCGVLLAQGYRLEQIQAVIPTLQVPAGRMQWFHVDDKPLVVVDYAHTPDALQQVLLTLRELCHGQLVVCFGCGGNRDKDKRAKMGKVASQYADQIWLTDDNPRNESKEKIVADILQGITAKVDVEHDRAIAIRRAIQNASKKDVVLIAGKGHEKYQLVGEQKIPFDDAVHVQQALRAAA